MKVLLLLNYNTNLILHQKDRIILSMIIMIYHNIKHIEYDDDI